MHTPKEQKLLNQKRRQRAIRVRAKIHGTATLPRFSVKRTNKYCYIQLINDDTGTTILSLSDKDLKLKGKKSEKSLELGKQAGQKALEKGIKKVMFDRHGYIYHGRVKAIAEGARAAGLIF